MRVRFDRTPVLIALLALLCYLPAANWGLPHTNADGRIRGWAVDDETPLGTLSQIREIVSGPTETRNLGYPLGHPLVVVGASAPYLAYLSLTGGLQNPSGEFPFGLADPEKSVAMLALIAHLVSVVFAIAAVLAAWYAARQWWGDVAGIWAAAIVGTTFPMFYYARTGNVDMAQLGWMAGAFAAAARLASAGVTARRAIALGVCVGAAIGTKEPITAVFLVVPFALAWRQWDDHRSGRRRLARWWLPGVAAAAAFAISFGLFSGLFLAPERYRAHVAFGQGRVGEAASGTVAMLEKFPWTLDGHVNLAMALTTRLADCLTAPGLVLCLAGVVLALVKKSPGAWFALPIATYLGVLFFAVHAVQLRYVMPAAWMLGLFGAYAAATAWASSSAVVRWGAVAVAGLAIALNLGRGLDLTDAMRHDSRYTAAAWFDEHATPGSRIAYFGALQKMPRLGPDVKTERAGEYRGAVFAVVADAQAEMRIVEGWRANPPDFVVLMPDHSSAKGVPYPASCPPSLVEGLDSGRLGYRLAASFQTPSAFPWVRRPLLDYPTVNPPIRIYQRVAG